MVGQSLAIIPHYSYLTYLESATYRGSQAHGVRRRSPAAVPQLLSLTRLESALYLKVKLFYFNFFIFISGNHFSPRILVDLPKKVCLSIT
jgi:hypothetical protein